MKKNAYYKLIYLALSFALCFNLNGQSLENTEWVWLKALSSNYAVYGLSIALDSKGTGDVYLVGGFEGKVDFDPGPEIFYLNTGSNAVNPFVSKYDSLGNFKWAKSLNGSVGGSYGLTASVNTSINGDIYITGIYSGTVEYDQGGSTSKLTSKGNEDIFIASLNSEGDFMWVKSIGGPGSDLGNSNVSYNSNSNVYFVGSFSGTVDFDPGPDSYPLNSGGAHGAFILKLDLDGNFVWAKAIVGPGSSDGYSIVIDTSGREDVYFSGSFSGTVDFDPGPESYSLNSIGNTDIFISKLDSLGIFQWAISTGGKESDVSRCIAFDPIGSGYVYTTGWFRDTVDFDPGPGELNLISKAGRRDIFVSKFSSTGNFLWAKSFGGEPEDEGNALATDPKTKGNIYIIGNFSGITDFDPGPGSFEVPSKGGYDTFISSLDSAGNFVGVKTMGGTSNDYITDIALDATGCNMIVSGYYKSEFYVFDSDTLINSNTASANLYFAKLKFMEPCATSFPELDNYSYNIFPNPATNELTIELTGIEFLKGDITLFTLSGEVVSLYQGENPGQKQTIDISALPVGIYFLEFSIDGKNVVEKVVKNNP